MAIRHETANISVANANVDGTGTIVDLATATGNGSRVERIYIKATQDTTAGMVRIFNYDGANWDLLHEEPVSVVNGDATTPYFSATVSLAQNFIKASQKIGVSTEKAETFNVHAMITDF